MSENELQYPKVLKTKEDYLFIMKNFPVEDWMEDVQKLISDATVPEAIGVLSLKKNVNGEFEASLSPFSSVEKFNMFQSRLQDDDDYEIISDFNYMGTEKIDEVRSYKNFRGRSTNIAISFVEAKDSKLHRLGFTMKELFIAMMKDSEVDDETMNDFTIGFDFNVEKEGEVQRWV